ncbi:MAG: nidogen-like domain-containing protein [Sulfitobacter sp.]
MSIEDIIGDGRAVRGLGGARGLGEIMLDPADDGSQQIDTSAVFENGFTIGSQSYGADSLYVNTNGAISFGAAMGYFFGALDTSLPIIAPFLADIDTRLDGEGDESGQVWVDVDPTADVVTVTWENVGYYRRKADLTNLFQVQLYDSGGGEFDLVFRYEDINWTAGNLQGGQGGLGGTAAVAGLSLPGMASAHLITGSGGDADVLALETQDGNTAKAGLWVFEVGSEIDLNEDGPGGGGTPLPPPTLIDYLAAKIATVVDFLLPQNNAGAAQGQVHSPGLELRGTTFADDLRGDSLDNLINGHIGNDFILGRDGNDILIGSRGHDILSGGNGADVLNGGIGNDRLVGGNDNDRLSGEDGNDVLLGGPGVNVLLGGLGNDIMLDGTSGSILYAADGDDRLIGNNGNDRLFGARGNDILNGGSGNDRLGGDEGNDYLVGGDGADWFIFRPATNRDRIADFQAVQDQLFLEEAIWGGGLTPQQVIENFATVEDGYVQLALAADAVILLEGWATTFGLADELTFI